jgi:hypothetical protein
MPVNLVTKMWSGDVGQITTADGKTFTFSQTDKYQVTCTPDTSRGEIALHPDVPKADNFLIGAPFIRVKDVSIQRHSPIYYTVTVQSKGESGSGDPSESPIDNKVKYKGGSVESQSEVDQDADGNPIVTPNNEPITGIKRDIYDYQFTITRNFLSISIPIAQQYLEATNSDTFLVKNYAFAPGTVRMRSYNHEPIEADGFDYEKVTATFLARRAYNTTADKAWYARTRLEGYYEKVGTSIIRAVDDDEAPVTKPVLLAADGTRVTDPANTYWKEIKLYTSLPYNALGF